MCSIGWSKAAKLTQIKDKKEGEWNAENLDKLLTFAEDKTNTRDDLDDKVKVEYLDNHDGQDPTKSKITTMRFKLFEDQANLVRAYLDAAIVMWDHVEHDDQALVAILEDHAVLTESSSIEVQLPVVMGMIEDRFGVKLAVVDESEAEMDTDDEAE